jgi:DNA-binding CsgD family transcriptional regulator/membrane protein implicated in regulation of membrane protease activity
VPWYVWLGLAVAAIIGEAFTLSLVLGSLAVAGGATAAVSPVTGLGIQIAVFCAVSVVMLVLVRPAVMRVLPDSGEETARPRIGPVGRRAISVERIDQFGGEIRIGRGEFFTARAAEPGMVVPPEREVQIVGMDGLAALVRPLQADEPEIEGPYPFGLSVREVEVLRLVAAGLSNAEIAERLVLSPRTVHHHVSHIFDKMGVNSRVDAARIAIREGIASPEEPREHSERP